MKQCDYCGRQNPEDAIYCSGCGTEIVVPEPESVSEPVPEAATNDPECDVPEGGEAALCPSCLFPNLPEARWCKRCGAPLDSNSMFLMPDAANAVGFVYRRALEGRPKLIVVLGIWIYFFPGFLVSLIYLPRALEVFARGPAGFAEVCYVAAYGTVCGSMLYRVTWNFFTLPKIVL